MLFIVRIIWLCLGFGGVTFVLLVFFVFRLWLELGFPPVPASLLVVSVL